LAGAVAATRIETQPAVCGKGIIGKGRMSASRHIPTGRSAARPSIVLMTLSILLLAVLPRIATASETSEFERARRAAAAGDLFEAESLLRDLIDDYPKGEGGLKAGYMLGRILYRRADYAGAAEEFSEILRKHPAWEHAAGAAYGLAMARIGMVDYVAAAKTLETMLASYPDSGRAPDAVYWLAESLYRRGDYSGSLEWFRRFLEEYPDHPHGEHALDAVAWCHEQLGEFDKAVDARKRFLEEFPDSPMREVSEFALAADYHETGEKGEAAERYLAIASTASALGGRALPRAGLILAEMGRTREAVDALEKLPAKDAPNNEVRSARIALANCYLRLGDYEAAEKILRALIDGSGEKPLPCDVSFQLALALAGQGKSAEAAERLATIPRQSDCDRLRADSALATAALLLDLNQPTIAAEQLESFLSARPASEATDDLLFALAVSLYRTERYDKAISVLAPLLKGDREFDTRLLAVYYDGLCRFRSGLYRGAAEKFGRFVARGEPAELVPPASYLEATSLLKAGKAAEAGRRYKAFAVKWPDELLSVTALYRAGLASMVSAEYEKALPTLETLNRRHAPAPEAVPGRYFLGVARMKMEDPGGAADVFRFLLEHDPGFELVDRARFAVGMIEFTRGNHESAASVLGGAPSEFEASDLADRAGFFAAAARYKIGLYKTAGAEFAELASLFPASPLAVESLFRAGMCEEKLGRPREAAALYEKAGGPAGRSEAGMQATYALAWTELGLSDGEKAAAAFEMLAGQHPPAPLAEHAYFWKGRLDYAGGRWGGATESLLELNRLYPQSEMADAALFFAARATRRSSDYNGATKLYEKLAREHPDSVFIEQADIEAAEAMIEAGKADEAARKFERFIKTNLDSPLRPLALYDMGKALQRAGKFERAIEQYKAAAGGETTELAARCRFAIAECLAELERGAEAIAELISIAQGGLPSGWAERARLQVARLLERDSRIAEARQVYLAIAAEYADDAAGMVALKAMERIDSDVSATAER